MRPPPLTVLRRFAVAMAVAVLAAGTVLGAPPELIEIARSPRDVCNGVAVTETGRVFGSFPRFVNPDTPAMGVGEILSTGTIEPYPGGAWNRFQPGDATDAHFIGVNAVVADKRGHLWVVDPAGTFGSNATPGAAKLVRIDLETNGVGRVYRFDTGIVPEKGFLNDVRVGDGYAYLTESGLGALIILNLETGGARRLLADDPRLKADPNVKPTINGQPWVNAKGEAPAMNVNPMELSPDGKYLYFQPSAGPNLLRVPVADLQDEKLPAPELAKRVEVVGPTRFNAGLTMAPDGSLFYSDVGESAITVRHPDGEFETVVQDAERLIWPDESSLGPDGYLYFPASQVDRLAPNRPDGKPDFSLPFRIFKVQVLPPPNG